MATRTQEDSEMIGVALDEYMICKGRPAMSIDSKRVWMKRLIEKDTKAVLWAIERAIGKEGWPEISVIFEKCKEYYEIHGAELARIAYDERNRKIVEQCDKEIKLLKPTPGGMAAAIERLRLQ